MTNESKIILLLLAIYLWFHWRGLRMALASDATGGAGNPTPGYSSTGGDSSCGAGNRFPETWGSW